MEIPFQELAADTLTAIIEEFITREATEYGDLEYSLAQKVEQVRQQLLRGEIAVNYDPESQTCHIGAIDSKPIAPDLGRQQSEDDSNENQ